MEGPGMQQWHKGLRHNLAATSEEGEGQLVRASEDKAEDSSYDLKAWELLMRFSGRP
jgi:hypothetical protein